MTDTKQRIKHFNDYIYQQIRDIRFPEHPTTSSQNEGRLHWIPQVDYLFHNDDLNIGARNTGDAGRQRQNHVGSSHTRRRQVYQTLHQVVDHVLSEILTSLDLKSVFQEDDFGWKVGKEFSVLDEKLTHLLGHGANLCALLQGVQNGWIWKVPLGISPGQDSDSIFPRLRCFFNVIGIDDFLFCFQS